jgi:hypothetical protein
MEAACLSSSHPHLCNVVMITMGLPVLLVSWSPRQRFLLLGVSLMAR